MLFKKVILGGTFDHLHLGHQALINKAFAVGEKVLIGLADEELVKNKFLGQLIESYSDRKKGLVNYLAQKKFLSRAEIVSINDIFGPTLNDNQAEAIIVSSATKKNASLINKERRKRGLKVLRIIKTNLVLAEDKKIISSERIRAGEINQQGKSYFLFFEKNKNKVLKLPLLLRQELRQPFGQVFNHHSVEKVGWQITQLIKKQKPVFVFSVGDIVSYSLIKNNFLPSLIFFDRKTKREKISPAVKRTLEIKRPIKIVNYPGTINLKSFNKVKIAVSKILTKKRSFRVLVQGEEDLLVLPLILLAPLKTLIIYGQINLGSVVVEVTQEVKNKAQKILQHFV